MAVVVFVGASRVGSVLISLPAEKKLKRRWRKKVFRMYGTSFNVKDVSFVDDAPDAHT
jgi:hypothetical protein